MGARARGVGGERPAFGAAFFLSAFGYEILSFAMTVRVYDISRMAINVGVLTAITLLPKLLSPAYGLFVDRAGAKRALAAAAASTAALAACLSAASSLVALYAIWLPLSVLFMVASNARTVLMTRIARGGGYVGMNSMAFSLLSAARLAAPACAGLLSRTIGAWRLMILAALAYGLCAACAAALREPGAGGPSGTSRAGEEDMLRQLAEGFARIRGSRELGFLVRVSAIRNGLLGFAPSLLIVLMTARLGGASADYGMAAAAAALGALGGSLAGPLLAEAFRPRLVAGLGLGAHFASFVALGLVGARWAAVLALAVGGFALYAAAIVLHSRRDAATELETRGRVYGANTAIQTLPALLSMLAGSALADRLGPAPVFVGGGALALADLAGAARGARPFRRARAGRPG